MTKSVDNNLATTFAAVSAARPFVVMSEVRLVRESISGVIERHFGYKAVLCENVARGLSAIRDNPGATILFDNLFPRGPETVREIRAIDPSASVVVFAISETEENVLNWANAGAAGYIPATAAIHELPGFIESIDRGEQICSATITSRLIRRLGSFSGAVEARNQPVATPVTAREQEIIKMIGEGMSNKEIARRLNIELSTTKTHVHNLLGKLGLQRRGQVAYWAHNNVAENNKRSLARQAS
jgi:DNA-binding NarL/FixJ family response regulator